MTAIPSDFLAAEKILGRSDRATVELCQSVIQAARRLVPLDAFYLCAVDRSAERLQFVYICDGELYGPGRELPIGEGPTSRVVRSGRPVVVQEETVRAGLSMNPFGSSEPSRSAVHWPVHLLSPLTELSDGVLSVQSYRPKAYDSEALAAIEWLTLRIAGLFGTLS